MIEKKIPEPRTLTPTLVQTNGFTSARAGYTLVEIAFASFVVGVAFLALVGLGRLAVQNAVDAENDTRSALLAEDIFATLRSTNNTISATGGPTAYTTFWINFTNGTEIVLFQTAGEDTETSAHYIDAEPYVTETTPWIYGNGTITRLKFVNPIAGSDVPQWTAQFSLSAQATNVLYNGAADEYITGPATNLTLASVTLRIWPSAYDRRERSRSFFTHIPYQGLTHGRVVE